MVKKIIIGFAFLFFATPVFSFAQNANTPKVYIFSASWCGPCHEMHAAMDSYFNQLEEDVYVIIPVDSDADPALTQKMRVGRLPTIIVVGADNKEKSRSEGWTTKDAAINAITRGGVVIGASGPKPPVVTTTPKPKPTSTTTNPPVMHAPNSISCDLEPASKEAPAFYICTIWGKNNTVQKTVHIKDPEAMYNIASAKADNRRIFLDPATKEVLINKPKPPKSGLSDTLPLVPGDPGYEPPVVNPPASSTIPVPPKVDVVSRTEQLMIDKKTGLLFYRLTVVIMVTSGNPPKAERKEIIIDARTVAMADDLIEKEIDKMQSTPPTPEPVKYIWKDPKPYKIPGFWVVDGQMCDGDKCTLLTFTVRADTAAEAKKIIEGQLRDAAGAGSSAQPFKRGATVTPNAPPPGGAVADPSARGTPLTPEKSAEYARKIAEQEAEQAALKMQINAIPKSKP